MPLSTIKNTGIADSSVASANITDGTIVNADVSCSAAIAASKISGVAANTDVNTIEQNIALLGFKMAVNEGLTVFNLVDGIVDEFHDESGTDEGEGSNDTYCASSDFYKNTTPTPAAISAGFGTHSVTEGDTSTVSSQNYPHPKGAHNECGSFGSFTVPTGMTSVNIQAWGAGGGAGGGPVAVAGGSGVVIVKESIRQISGIWTMNDQYEYKKNDEWCENGH